MGSQGGGSHASPFVLAAALHGVHVVPHIINAVILLFEFVSVASSALYSSSRTLQSLSEQGLLQDYFNYIDREGRPFRVISCTFLDSFPSLLLTRSRRQSSIGYLQSLVCLRVFTWTAICTSHIRFQYALKYNGISTDALGYKASTGVDGSVYTNGHSHVDLGCSILDCLVSNWCTKPDAKTFPKLFGCPVSSFLHFTLDTSFIPVNELYVKLKTLTSMLIELFSTKIVEPSETKKESRKIQKYSFPRKVWKVFVCMIMNNDTGRMSYLV